MQSAVRPRRDRSGPTTGPAQPRPRGRRPLVAGVAAVLATAATVAGTTGTTSATLSATHSGPAGAAHAATVALAADQEPRLDFSGLRPGTSSTRPLSIAYRGSIPATVSLRLTTGTGGSDLCSSERDRDGSVTIAINGEEHRYCSILGQGVSLGTVEPGEAWTGDITVTLSPEAGASYGGLALSGRLTVRVSNGFTDQVSGTLRITTVTARSDASDEGSLPIRSSGAPEDVPTAPERGSVAPTTPTASPTAPAATDVSSAPRDGDSTSESGPVHPTPSPGPSPAAQPSPSTPSPEPSPTTEPSPSTPSDALPSAPDPGPGPDGQRTVPN